MTKTVLLRQNYQLVNHRRNKFLHKPINIAGEIWNYCIAYQRWAYRSFGAYVRKYDMMRHAGALRRDVTAYQHWQLLNRYALSEVCDRVDKAYTRFFERVKRKQLRYRVNKKTGRRTLKDRPTFRAVKKFRSIALTMGNGCKLLESENPRIGRMQFSYGWRGAEKMILKYHIGNRPLEGRVKSVTIMRTRDGKFFLSFVVEREMSRIAYPSTGKIGGFDFGLIHFLTTDEGVVIDSPQYLFQERDELRRRDRKLLGRGRKTIGSGSWKRAQRALALHHAKIANRRDDFHWKLAHVLCAQNDVLVFEKLNLEGMLKLWGRKVTDLGFYSFLLKLEWVAKKSGRKVVYADLFFASSKTCSACDHAEASMPLSQREFHCSRCGLVMGRDHNAARNLAKLGRDSVPGQSGVSDLRRDSASGALVLTAEPSA